MSPMVDDRQIPEAVNVARVQPIVDLAVGQRVMHVHHRSQSITVDGALATLFAPEKLELAVVLRYHSATLSYFRRSPNKTPELRCKETQHSQTGALG